MKPIWSAQPIYSYNHEDGKDEHRVGEKRKRKNNQISKY